MYFVEGATYHLNSSACANVTLSFVRSRNTPPPRKLNKNFYKIILIFFLIIFYEDSLISCIFEGKHLRCFSFRSFNKIDSSSNTTNYNSFLAKYLEVI